MKKLFGVVVFMVGFLATTYVMAQVYEGKENLVKDPMDRAAAQHAAVYANVANPGEEEESLPQEARYSNMTEPMEQANDQHFNSFSDYQTVEESLTTK